MLPWDMFLQADVVVAILNLALLGGVGAFLVFLHVRMRQLKRDLQALPQLSVTLNKSILQAQADLKTLKAHLQEVEPTASRLIKDGQNIAQDLDFFIHRAQKTVQKLEAANQQQAASSPETPALEAQMQARAQTRQPVAPPPLPFEARLEAELDAEQKPDLPHLPEGVGVSPAEEKLRARLGRLGNLGKNRG